MSLEEIATTSIPDKFEIVLASLFKKRKLAVMYTIS